MIEIGPMFYTILDRGCCYCSSGADKTMPANLIHPQAAPITQAVKKPTKDVVSDIN